ncbi:class I SAM-dependent methyltransferase [Methylocella sp. CPCC 101449]|uniref:class I SAM-dependent methyltransferase n=1 Tax=Methylocella sp. CPCC 101449 TaxID=2987531 RepID=UPI00288EC9E5|nr:class I SAM-dependent methyltransferase [Methylocella sp. CPCC 101449]MDT2019450.1 class I SAM-dependent methyltransferase [Methylocella sp. CPCC 101449]
MTPDDRRAMKRRAPHVSLSIENLKGGSLLPDRLALLDVLPKNAVVAEVGVAFGDFTREIVRRAQPSSLHLIDAWSSDRYKSGLAAIEEEHAEAIQAKRVQIHHGLSIEVLPTLPDQSLDWIYIDTDHSYETTWAELVIAEQKVRLDGYICGHDFCVGNVITPWPYGVIEACNKFCVEYGWRYSYLTVESNGHNSFGLQRLGY